MQTSHRFDEADIKQMLKEWAAARGIVKPRVTITATPRLVGPMEHHDGYTVSATIDCDMKVGDGAE